MRCSKVSYFEEMLRQRMESDQDALSDVMLELAGSVIGYRSSNEIKNKWIVNRNAVTQILKYYGLQVKEWPEHLKETEDILDYICSPSGLMRRVVKLEKGWHRKAFDPMLARRTDNQELVALIPGRFTGYYIVDPVTGKATAIREKNEALIEPQAICFYKALPETKLSFRDLIRYMWLYIKTRDKFSFLAAALAGLAVGMLFTPLNSLIYAEVLESENFLALFTIIVFLLSAKLSQSIMDMLKDLAQKRIAAKLSVVLQAAFMMRILMLPTSFFRKYTSGELAARVDQVTVLCEKIVSSTVLTGYTMALCLVYLIQVAFYSFRTFLAMSAGTALILLTIYFIVKPLITQKLLTLEFQAKEHGMVYASLLGISKIRLSGNENQTFATWGSFYSKVAKAKFNPDLWLKVYKAVPNLFTMLMLASIYYFQAGSGMHAGSYFGIMTAYGLITGALNSLIQSTDDLASIWPSYEMMRPVLEEVPEGSKTNSPVAELSGEIRLRNVTFSYTPESPKILEHLSLEISSGQYVAIVGKTGCGKSTLVRLLLGFERPQGGSIYYDEKRLDQLDLRSVRQKIGTVLQDGKLFIGDIYSNIVLCKPTLSEEEAWEAAAMAGIAEDIKRMPMGMRTLISEENGGISGGQKQRLMIARAIAPKPKILIFDEATSALDNISQQIVTDSLDKMDCTRLVIAHRLSTIKSCDRILVMDGGKIIADGSYDKLMETCPFFVDLVHRQTLDE